ncbi:hypothetical protein [Accumulibacter sp.]|uniref:hypothetical protein n=1 Tax=Accumulibacter sp. TaxID=2053492 RepID=UPI0025CD66E4|nr:hypothetical protein [Accumulibacter sp.]MCP5228078.1 hypothetical protein [Accumulibacter sp.]
MRPQLHPFAVVLAAFLVGLSNPTLGADLAHLLDGKAFQRRSPEMRCPLLQAKQDGACTACRNGDGR